MYQTSNERRPTLKELHQMAYGNSRSERTSDTYETKSYGDDDADCTELDD